jgi:hypothetical protein
MADALAKLRAPAADVWVASAEISANGRALPYLVPLSLAWIDERVVLALDANSRTARNIVASRVCRLGLGPTRDVVMIDAVLGEAVRVSEALPALADRYAAQADWDPRQESGDYLYLVLRPDRIQAWREANELAGRTLMRDGRWLDESP